ncbi:alternative ribosome rescue aminoacyl-tRNA hydrolase ArfB [Pedobacter sp. KR3-3]|uniref:Alternative ribosome rescue aminoacyl-tRNA hydrolase ArfB n=1 Tax=Pedobacter albus TaxID=3113905 RepID=A0ABU7I272_9SPHI|nr:alternative ribosome rescue aminoacyl-tRNA hydrolase ArfB [Pedobacter sp. KR3-3]MEE1943492.1 alternative ribosome rescue aminoacyl-tRNA hydrolase ArfB [Pedobacter sp. KR3-3]
MVPSKEELFKEVLIKTSRSGGKGGQHVNKVSSKVELVFNIATSSFFTEEERALLLERLASRLDAEGNLHIVAQEDRSQLLNKQRAILKLGNLLSKSLQVQKKRKPTKVPKAVIEKRLQNKAAKSEKKRNRKSLDF